MPESRHSTRARRWLRRIAAILVLAIGAFIALAWITFLRSRPEPEGTAVVRNLSADVTVQRDDHGIAIIHGTTYADTAAGLGFAHGQDRFFQMDLIRRFAAGELAAMLGGGAPLSVDRNMRRYRYRAAAQAQVAALTADERAILDAYVSGVNAGLESLRSHPPEYWILRTDPQPWTIEDSILVMYYFNQVLADNARFERQLGVMHDALHPELVTFLTPATTRHDRPLTADDTADPTGGYEPIPIPGPDVVNLREAAPSDFPRELNLLSPNQNGIAPGSNAWAVAGSLTEHGGAILANDPHLRLTAPATWYRAELHWKEDGRDRWARGISVAGSAGIIIGCNDAVAWGFTNLYADQDDLVIIEMMNDPANHYATPDGPREIETVVETIDVRGDDPVSISVRETIWGPIIDQDHKDRPLALRSTAGSVDTMDALLPVDRATSLEHALDLAATWRGPSQSFLAADDQGRIGWTCTGFLPNRIGFDGSTPQSWANGDCDWDGSLDGDARPRILDPESGILYSANSRLLAAADSEKLGSTWAPAHRTNRIRARLDELIADRQATPINEESMRQMQLDTMAARFEPSRQILLEAIEADSADRTLGSIRSSVEQWDGTSDAKSDGFLVLRRFERTLEEMVMSPILKPCRDLDPTFIYNWFRREEPFLRILEERPDHLLPPRYQAWDDLIDDALRRTIARMTQPDPRTGDIPNSWGQANQLAIQHPLGGAVPFIGGMMNMDSVPQSGHTSSIRVATPDFGASMRMAVSPGHLDDAFLQMPCGQSGHFLSEHYDDLHLDWLLGRAVPFVAGAPISEWTLTPTDP